MDKYIEVLEKWLADPDSVSQEELDNMAETAWHAAYEIAISNGPGSKKLSKTDSSANDLVVTMTQYAKHMRDARLNRAYRADEMMRDAQDCMDRYKQAMKVGV